MKEEFKNINEMSDSRELLEARPNPIIPLFIYLIIAILALALIWSYFGEMDEVVKANGVIRTNEIESTVRNQEPNQVNSILFFEGQYVEEGDILFTMDISGKEFSGKLIEEELEEVENRLVNLEILKDSVNQGRNLFKTDNEFSERFISYESNLSITQLEFESTSLEITQNIEEQNKQKKGMESQRKKIEGNVKQLDRLKEVIEYKKNIFKKDETPYYNQAADIVMAIERMEKEKNVKREKYEEIRGLLNENNESIEQSPEDLGGNLIITQEQVDEQMRLYEAVEYELQQYINQQLLQVNNDIILENTRLEEVKNTLDAGQDFSALKENRQNNYLVSLDSIKSDMVIQINNEISSTEQNIEQLRQELSVLDKQMEESVIRAPIEGVVNVRAKISVGDFIQAGTEVLTIVPEINASTYKVQLTVPNHDIINTKIGDRVSFRIHSLPYQEYGIMYGEITKISTDAVHDLETGLSYYLVEASIDNDILHSYKGKEANIKVGMTTDAHIIAESKKVLYFLLEKIDLRE